MQRRPLTTNARWWMALVVVLIAGGALHFTGYDYSLPLYEEIDEIRFMNDVFIRRGLLDEVNFGLHPGYPPGILLVYGGVQLFVEARNGLPAYETTADVIRYVRVLVVLTNVVTAFFLALTARKLGGDFAGLAAPLAWFVPPVLYGFIVVGLPQIWEGAFTLAAAYFGVWTLESRRPRWAIVSVLLGLGAVTFKYVAFPALGPGVGAALWNLYTADRDERRRWWRTLGVQLVLIALGAVVLLSAAEGLFESGHDEAIKPLNGGLLLLLDAGQVLHIFTDAAAVVGLDLPVLAGMLLPGTVLYLRQAERWQQVGWLFVVGLMGFHLWLMVAYLVYELLVERYTLPVSALLVMTMVIALLQVAAWAIGRLRQPPAAQYVLAALMMAVWWVPIFPQTWTIMQARIQPVLPYELSTWARDTLPPGAGTILVHERRTFDQTWGAYDGPPRPWVEDHVMSRPIEEWRAIYVDYAEVRDDELAAMRADPRGRAYLDHMLLMRQLPHSSATTRSTYVFRLWRMEHETDVLFGNLIRLTGYDLSTTTPQPGEAVALTLYWQPFAVPQADYHAYVHFVGPEDRSVISQQDGPPAAQHRPTTTWDDTGETLISNELRITIPPDTPPGEYRLLVGLYNPATGERLLTQNGDDFTLLARLSVGQAGPSARQ